MGCCCNCRWQHLPEWIYAILRTDQPEMIIVITINIFVQSHKVVTSEVLGLGSVLLRRGKRESPGEEECL